MIPRFMRATAEKTQLLLDKNQWIDKERRHGSTYEKQLGMLQIMRDVLPLLGSKAGLLPIGRGAAHGLVAELKRDLEQAQGELSLTKRPLKENKGK